jgi:hypothetical protein
MTQVTQTVDQIDGGPFAGAGFPIRWRTVDDENVEWHRSGGRTPASSVLLLRS